MMPLLHQIQEVDSAGFRDDRHVRAGRSEKLRCPIHRRCIDPLEALHDVSLSKPAPHRAAGRRSQALNDARTLGGDIGSVRMRLPVAL